MDALFQKFLADAENAGLPEGDYLKVCSILKKSFESAMTPDVTHYKLPQAIELECECEFGGIIFGLSFHTLVKNPNHLPSVLYTLKTNRGTKENIEIAIFHIRDMIVSLLNAYTVDSLTYTSAYGVIDLDAKTVLTKLNDQRNILLKLNNDEDDEKENQIDYNDFYMSVSCKVIRQLQHYIQIYLT